MTSNPASWASSSTKSSGREASEGYADASEGWARGRGCLLCNTAVERAALDPGARLHVDAYLERLTRVFRHALGNARQRDELDPEVDLDELASLFTMALIGVAAMIRAEAAPALVQAACGVTTSVLDGKRSKALP